MIETSAEAGSGRRSKVLGLKKQYFAGSGCTSARTCKYAQSRNSSARPKPSSHDHVVRR